MKHWAFVFGLFASFFATDARAINLGAAPYNTCGKADSLPDLYAAIAAIDALPNPGADSVFIPCSITLLGAFVPPSAPWGGPGSNTTPTRPALTIRCAGSPDFAWIQTAPYSVVIDLRYAGSSVPAKMFFNAAGTVRLVDCTFLSGGSDDYPLVMVTNATLVAENVLWRGRWRPDNSNTQQDAILLGGQDDRSSTLATGDTFAGFFGFGSTFIRNRFSNLRRWFSFGGSANGISIIDPWGNGTNGGDAPMYFSGAGYGAQGNNIVGGGMELGEGVPGYQYGVVFKGVANRNTFTGFGLWDGGNTTQALVRCAPDTRGNQPVGNLFLGGYRAPNYPIFSGAPCATLY